MKSDFYYPEIADRKSLEEWADSDQLDMGKRADYQALKILQEYWPNHLSRETTDFLSKRFPLDLNRSNK